MRRPFLRTLVLFPSLALVACNALVNRESPIQVSDDGGAVDGSDVPDGTVSGRGDAASDAAEADARVVDAGTPADAHADAAVPDATLGDAGEGGTIRDSGPDGLVEADAGPVCPDGGCPILTVAGTFVFPADVEVDDTHVYWFVYGGQNQGLDGFVYRLPKDRTCIGRDAGCLDLLAYERFRITQSTIAPNDVCWTESYEYDREVVCFSKNQGTLRRIARGQSYAFAPTYDDGVVYWVLRGTVDAGPAAIVGASLAAGIDAGTRTVVSGRRHVSEFVAQGAEVVWSEGNEGEDGGLFAVGKDGGALRQLASASNGPRYTNVHGGFVYWSPSGENAIYRAPLSGAGPSTRIVTTSSFVFDLRVDDVGIVWAEMGTPPNNLDSAVRAANLDGSDVRTLAYDQPSIAAMTADATHAYFVVNGTRTANYEDGELRRAVRF